VSVVYTPAPAVEKTARAVINKWHPHLSDVRIEYVFRDSPAKSKGRVVLGKARKLSGLNAWLARLGDVERDGDGALFRDGDEAQPVDDFFVIEIAEPVWEAMDSEQRFALVDHELSHCIVEESDSGLQLKVAGHDLEEFEAVVRRHGLWKPDVERFVKAAVESGDLSFSNEDGGDG
jgi:hypothetical protein